MRNFEEMAHDYKRIFTLCMLLGKINRSVTLTGRQITVCCEVLDLLFLQLLHEHFVHVQDPPQLQVPAEHKKKSHFSFMWSAGNKQRIK